MNEYSSEEEKIYVYSFICDVIGNLSLQFYYNIGEEPDKYTPSNFFLATTSKLIKEKISEAKIISKTNKKLLVERRLEPYGSYIEEMVEKGIFDDMSTNLTYKSKPIPFLLVLTTTLMIIFAIVVILWGKLKKKNRRQARKVRTKLKRTKLQ